MEQDRPGAIRAQRSARLGLIYQELRCLAAETFRTGADIQNLPHLIVLARETLRTVQRNVVFSMSMNLLAVCLSFLGIIGPAFGAIMHELSALPVLAYSARLVSYRRNDTR